MIEGYLTIKEIVENWGVARRRVQTLCGQGRIPDATGFWHEWAIPVDAERPADGRVTTGKYRKWRKNGKSDLNDIICPPQLLCCDYNAGGSHEK